MNKSTQFNLGVKLHKMKDEGSMVDLILAVGDSKLYAHKVVVAAASDIFANILKEQMTQGDGDKGMSIINLPEGTSVQAAKALINIMYLETGGKISDLKLLLEVMSLCDKYLVEELLHVCISPLQNKLSSGNCLQICEASFGWKRGKILLDAGFACVASNIVEILGKSATSFSYRMWEKILTQEGPNVVEIEEHALFVRLLKWRNADISREEEFKKLVSLIRFPLMEASIIVKDVKPSGVLSDAELNELFCYIIGGGNTWRFIPKFTTYSRKSKIAHDSAELESLLKTASPGDFIQLLDGEYFGCFNLPDKVTLKGVGSTTVVTPPPGSKDNDTHAFMLRHDSRISDLKIVRPHPQPSPTLDETEKRGLIVIGSRNMVINVDFLNCYLHLEGSHNVIKNIKGEGGTGVVFLWRGAYNSISSAFGNNIEDGVDFDGGIYGNIVNNVTCSNVKYGVVLASDGNIVEGVSYEFSPERRKEPQIAIMIWGGCKNKVSQVTCQGYDDVEIKNMRKKGQYNHLSILIQILEKDGKNIEPKENIVTDCGPGEVRLTGENNYLANVDAGDLIMISGRDHKLEKCVAQRCVDDGLTNVKLIDCNFTY